MSKEEPRIYERNPDTGVIRSRPFNNYDPEEIRIEDNEENVCQYSGLPSIKAYEKPE